eukprot:g16441.t1
MLFLWPGADRAAGGSPTRCVGPGWPQLRLLERRAAAEGGRRAAPCLRGLSARCAQYHRRASRGARHVDRPGQGQGPRAETARWTWGAEMDSLTAGGFEEFEVWSGCMGVVGSGRLEA